MTDEKVLCPDDGEICLMTEEEKKGMGCWLCPKIQNLRETPYDKERKEGIDNDTTKNKERIS